MKYVVRRPSPVGGRPLYLRWSAGYVDVLHPPHRTVPPGPALGSRGREFDTREEALAFLEEARRVAPDFSLLAECEVVESEDTHHEA